MKKEVKNPGGRPRMIDGAAQTEMIRARVTPEVAAAYAALGGKSWLLALIQRAASRAAK